LSGCEGHLAKIRAAISEGDCAALKGEAHAFKGALANLRARRATESARVIEQMARQGDLTGASDAYTKLHVEIESLKPALASALDLPARTYRR
jgi:HPt (histidine-containing phosphotransfer) domain-containing protein